MIANLAEPFALCLAAENDRAAAERTSAKKKAWA
jgi:hypothetical protein